MKNVRLFSESYSHDLSGINASTSISIDLVTPTNCIPVDLLNKGVRNMDKFKRTIS